MTGRSFPKVVDALGGAIALASVWLAGRIAWEHTVLTWTSGPQMVGFSLMHSELGIILYLASLIAGPIWVIVVLFFAWRTRSLGTWITRVAVATYAISIMVLLLPDGLWERIFIEQMARSPHAPDLLYYAAARGEKSTVEAYLARGLPVNSRTCNEALTAAHGAARSGDIEMLGLLIARGADINATSAYGNSPLCDAEKQDRTEAIELLLRNGGKRIVGTPAQRDAALKASISSSFTSAPKCAVAQQGVLSEPPALRCSDS